jgi:nucleotide-binding universal stress UspA family protein
VINPKGIAMNESPTPRPIVVGIDGSKAAIRAALWAVDEAVSRDVPVRLLYAIEHRDTVNADSEAAARELATAEIAVRRALTAIEATGQPVKIETEIVQGPPLGSLIGASAFAAMVCVGAVGLRHFRPVRVGDIAAALALSAQCPVAIIREPHNQPRQPGHRIVVEVDKSPDNDVLLGVAMEEARLRNARVEAIICRRIVSDDTAAEGDAYRRQMTADLDRRLAGWKHRYPHLGVESVAVDSTFMEFLAYNCQSVQLVIVGAHNREHLKELLGPVGGAILQDADCSLLVVNRQHL